MDKKIKDTDYLFLSTRVRALETQMLTRDRMEQMLEAKVPEDAASVLLDCGYGDIRPLTVIGLNQALSAEQEKIYSDAALGPNSTPTPTPTPEPTPTPTPTPAPTYKVPDKTVQSGSEGADAKTVQRRLKDLGYYTGRIDGEFGKASVEALKRFQTANGLIADGKAGRTTYAILFSNMAKTAAKLGLKCEVSMDQHMGCGVGACFACVIKVVDKSSPDGWRYSRSCKEGVVYPAEEVYHG